MASNAHSNAVSIQDVDAITLDEVSADATANNNTSIVRDRYGFFVTDEFHKYVSIPPAVIHARKSKEGERALKWIRMIKKWKLYETVPRRFPKLRRRCRKGIPDAVRGHIWFLLADGEQIQKQFPNLQDIDTSTVSQVTIDEIERDIDRTFPRHVLFAEDGGAGQTALRRVLTLYAALDPEVGHHNGPLCY